VLTLCVRGGEVRGGCAAPVFPRFPARGDQAAGRTAGRAPAGR